MILVSEWEEKTGKILEESMLTAKYLKKTSKYMQALKCFWKY